MRCWAGKGGGRCGVQHEGQFCGLSMTVPRLGGQQSKERGGGGGGGAGGLAM